MADQQPAFRPFVSPETNMAEFTIKSVLTGAAFGIVFGAATVYLALKAWSYCFCFYPYSLLLPSLLEGDF
jgi:hypothetical protein